MLLDPDTCINISVGLILRKRKAAPDMQKLGQHLQLDLDGVNDLPGTYS